MMEYYVVFDTATGAVRWRGQGPEGTASLQMLSEGLAALTVPQACLAGEDFDIEPLRIAVLATIDERAETVRQRYLTPGAGQALTYQRKEAEARAWHEGATPAHFPFLSAEADATGVTIDTLAAEVIAMADQWAVIGSAIEGVRMAAKKAVAEASGLPQIIAAAAVTWPA